MIVEYNSYVKTSAVKRLIAINHIQNKRFGLHNICVCVYIYIYIYIHIHTGAGHIIRISSKS